MRITLTATREIVECLAPDGGPGAIPCRVWIGETERGVPMRALIALLAVERTEDQSAFELELAERFPHVDAPRVFPSRLVL